MEEKNLDYYMSLPYEANIIPDPSGGYVASVPDLPGCITQGDTPDEIFYMIEDAKKTWLEAALDWGETIEEPVPPGEYGSRMNIRLPKTLHKELAEIADKEGINLNQMVIYLLTKSLDEKKFAEAK